MADLSAELVCGVDGGQSATRCVLCTLEGQLVGWGAGGPLIHLSTEGGAAHLVGAVSDGLRTAWAAAGIAPRPLAAIGLGLTGVEGGTPEAETAARLVSGLLPGATVVVRSDAAAALIGAHEGRAGAIVISGTGTIALGMDAAGSFVRAGGWGWLLGDEGSAYAIGRAGLLAALMALDGTGPPTALESAFAQHFGIASLRGVKRLVYASSFGAAGFAGLASVVSRAADQGDAIAAGIIRRAGRALAVQVGAVLRQLDFGETAPAVAPLGGAFEHVSGLLAGFKAEMRANSTPATIVHPSLPAVLGAAIMAIQGARERRGCGQDVTPLLPALRAAARTAPAA